MTKFPTLHTPRLILGQLEVSDIPTIVEYADNPNIANNLRDLPQPYREKDAIFWLNMARQGFENQTEYIFKLGLKETNEFIGGMGLHLKKPHHKAELGYWIGEPFWNQGYATEAARAVLKFGFEALDLNKIYAKYYTYNPASGKVMVKNNMIKEAEFVDTQFKLGKFVTEIQYRLTKREYETLNNK